MTTVAHIHYSMIRFYSHCVIAHLEGYRATYPSNDTYIAMVTARRALLWADLPADVIQRADYLMDSAVIARDLMQLFAFQGRMK